MITKYIITFILSLIICVLIYNTIGDLYWILLMPLVVTNGFLPFMVWSSDRIEYKWELVFFFLVPFSTFLYIFVDGFPSVIMGIKESWSKLK